MNAMSEIHSLRQDVPHSIEAEQAILGAVMVNNLHFDLVGDLLQPDHFFDPLHGEIFRRIRGRITADLLASPVTMAPLLNDTPLDKVGGGAYLVRMCGAAPGPTSLRDYALTVLDCFTRRMLITAVEDAGAMARSGQPVTEAVAHIGHALMTMPQPKGSESSVSLAAAIMRAVDQINATYQGTVTFLKTGIPALDAILRGLGPGDFCLMGGATSMGKTATGVEIARHVAVEQNMRVAYWSREMSEEQLASRMTAGMARMPYASLRDASSLAEQDFRKFLEAAQKIGDKRLQIIPKSIVDITAGEAALRSVARKMDGLDLLIVDYAQLIKAQGKSRYEQMTEVSTRLKDLAGMLKCPLIGMVQLDRNLIERDERRPHLSDVKETGQFENDCDQAVFCHREEYYLDRLGPRRDKSGKVTVETQLQFETDSKRWKNKMELIVRKNRHGGIGTAEVGFHAPTNRFWSLADEGAGFFE
jgi:replicative DNA helicase